MRWIAHLALAAVVVAVAPLRTFADPAAAVAPGDLKAAKNHFDQAGTSLHAGDYGGALAEFQESYKLNPLPSVLYNMGLCEKGLFHYTEAVPDLTQYLSHRAELPPARAAEAQKVLDELQKLLADVLVDITPVTAWDGATVLIDTRAIPAATLVHPVKLASGAHTIEVSRDGYKPVKRDITVVSGVALHVAIALEALPTTARLHVTASSERATVAVDAVVKGLAPLDVELPGGGHR